MFETYRTKCHVRKFSILQYVVLKHMSYEQTDPAHLFSLGGYFRHYDILG